MFPTSFLPPLQRLQVTDGLLLTAERWQVAHTYHRQRQNLQFQALSRPGIVQGLGICPIPAPADVASQYHDGRWLQVQPGIAIDCQGNPILVPQPVTYHIAAQPRTEPMWAYLVLSFVDPDQLDGQPGTHVVQETFRLDEKVSLPTADEIELCRIYLTPDEADLRVPNDGFAPAMNELDLRYRPIPHAQPQGQLNLGYLTVEPSTDTAVEMALQGLVNTLPSLYPHFEGSSKIGWVNVRQGSSAIARQEELQAYDLLYLHDSRCQSLQPDDCEFLQTYLKTGGVLLIEISTDQTGLADLLSMWNDVTQSLASLNANLDNPSLHAELHHEQITLEGYISHELAQHVAPFTSLISKSGSIETGHPGGQLSSQHPLRTTPFPFGWLPVIHDIPLAMFNWGGVVVILGELSSAWGGETAQFLSRDVLRSAHELGINLLHFAWQRRHWATCLTPVTHPFSDEPPPKPTEYSRRDAAPVATTTPTT
jgi:hypothetical protein